MGELVEISLHGGGSVAVAGDCRLRLITLEPDLVRVAVVVDDETYVTAFTSILALRAAIDGKRALTRTRQQTLVPELEADTDAEVTGA